MACDKFSRCHLLTPVAASALEKRYVATPQQSNLADGGEHTTRVSACSSYPQLCSDAEFLRVPVRKMNLDFELKMRRPMGTHVM